MRIYRKTTNFWRHASRQFIWIGIECFQVEQTTSLKCQNFSTWNGLAFWKQYAICHRANWDFIWWESYGERQRILNLHKNTYWQLQSSNAIISHASRYLCTCVKVCSRWKSLYYVFKFYTHKRILPCHSALSNTYFVVVIRARFQNKL